MVRVTTSYLSVHVLKEAVVSGDSLVGVDEAGERTAIHIGAVRRIEIQRFDGIGTAFLVGGAVLAVGALAWAAECAKGDSIIC
jgi:hypothetical protein